MKLENTFALRNGIQNTGDPMTDIVLYNATNKKRSKQNTDGGENKVPVIYVVTAKTLGKQVLDKMDGGFKEKSGNRCK